MIISKRLNQGRFPIMEKQTEPHVVAYTCFMGLDEVGKHIRDLRAWAEEQGLLLTGAPTCCFQMPAGTSGDRREEVACEARWPIADGPALQNGKMGTRMVSAEHVLSTFHLGDTETIDETFQVLQNVLQEAGYQSTGKQQEVYLFDVCYPKSKWVTEAQVTICKDDQP